METHQLVVLGIAVGMATSCGGSSVRLQEESTAPVGARWNGALATPGGLAGVVQVTGTSWMAPGTADGETMAHVEITNATPGGVHPWHVHVGRCGSRGGVLGPADAYEPLEVGGNGRAQRTATVPVRFPTRGSYFVNVHASQTNLQTIIACANLAPPAH